MLFFLALFCLQVFPQALLLQTATAGYRLNKSVGPGEMEYMSLQLLQLPIPHFTRPFCYWDMFTLPRLAFQRGSLGPRASIPVCPSLKLAAPFPTVLPHLRRPCIRVFPQGFSIMLLGEGEVVGIRPDSSTLESGPEPGFVF